MNPKKIKWKDVFEVLTAIGTLTLAFFAYLAWKESITSSELATRALVSSNRAWLAVRKMKVTSWEGSNISIDGQLVNLGKEPAINVVSELTFYKATRDSFFESWNQNEIFNTTPCNRNIPAKRIEAGAVFPGAETELVAYGVYQALDGNYGITWLIVLSGCVRYETFSMRHQTSVCAFLEIPKSGNVKGAPFTRCERGNDAD